MKRYKKDYAIDGWPIADIDHGVVLGTDEIVNRLNKYEGILLRLLYHHQGACSPIGQPIREVLGIDPFDDLTVRQIERAKAYAERVK